MKSIGSLKLLAIALVAMLAIFAAGCGDDGDDASSGSAAEESAAPTKAEYIEQVDEFCAQGLKATAKYSEQYNAAFEKLNTSTTVEEAAVAAKEIDELMTARSKVRDSNTMKMAAFETPEEGGPTAYLKARKQLGVAVDKMIKTVTAYSKDTADQDLADAITAAADATTKPDDEATKLAAEYGFKICGKPVEEAQKAAKKLK